MKTGLKISHNNVLTYSDNLRNFGCRKNPTIAPANPGSDRNTDKNMKITRSFRKNHRIQPAISNVNKIAGMRGSHGARRRSGERLLVPPASPNFPALDAMVAGQTFSANSHCWEVIEKTPAGIIIEKDFNRSDVTLARRVAACRKLIEKGIAFDGTVSLKNLRKMSHES